MRGIIATLAGAAAIVAASGTLAAQTPAPRKETRPAPDRDAPRGTMCYSTDKENTNCQSFFRMSPDSAMMKRPALGIQLSPTGSLRDTIGVFVARVTPKGPAENAGIVEGDRIVSINGVDLRVNSADAGDSYASDLPTRRLTREVAKLTPGRVVNLRVSSGGRIRDVAVTVGRASDLHEGGMPFMMGVGPEGMIPGGAMRYLPRMNMQDFQGPRMRIEQMPRMRMEDMPRMRPEDMERMKERLRELPLRLREMDGQQMWRTLPDGGRYLAPGATRVRVITPNGRDGATYIYRDSGKVWSSDMAPEARKKAEKTAAERAEKAKKEKK